MRYKIAAVAAVQFMALSLPAFADDGAGPAWFFWNPAPPPAATAPAPAVTRPAPVAARPASVATRPAPLARVAMASELRNSAQDACALRCGRYMVIGIGF